MDHREKIARLRRMLEQVAPGDGIESVRSPEDAGAESAGFRAASHSAADISKAASGRKKMQQGREAEIDPAEARGLEAIILPRERPVFFVKDGGYLAMPAPWTALNDAATMARMQEAISSIGRVELPTNPRIPYGGTGFLVGDGLLMTNRHVAEIFVEGLGVTRLRFRRGDAAVDFRCERDSPEDDRSAHFDVLDVVMVHPYWDMALLRIAGLPDTYKPLTLSTNEAGDGANIVAIGYPARDDRNDLEEQDRIFERKYNVKRLQPGKARGRQRIRSFENDVDAMTHDSSTLGGNSGSAIIDPATGHAVALHFAGIYLKANYGVPAFELARDSRVVDAGVRFSGSLPPTDEWEDAWRRIDAVEQSADSSQRPPSATSTSVTTGAPGDAATWTIPLQVTVSVGTPTRTDRGAVPDSVAAAVEAMRIPVIFDGLEERDGFDPDFLEIQAVKVEPPALTKSGEKAAARLEDGSFELKYHKFSVVMHKRRRLAIFTAANVDWSDASRKVDGKKPSRKELTGLGDSDIEKWVTDWRIPEEHQLPDVFYSKDGGAFDKGHLVRRDDVAWGSSFEDMQMSNGDTYHTTNCSPQVGGFNQSSRGEDNWGDLENMVQKATRGEKAIIFSGPALAPDDRLFDGRSEKGSIVLRIPRRFWKIVVVKTVQGPEAFGFVLEQDLAKVPLREEMAVPEEWKAYMQPIGEIGKLLYGLASLDALVPWDRYDSAEGLRIQAQL